MNTQEMLAMSSTEIHRLRAELAQKDAELERMRRDYALFEELSPPDMPRTTFVQWCFSAWEKSMEQDEQSAETEVASLKESAQHVIDGWDKSLVGELTYGINQLRKTVAKQGKPISRAEAIRICQQIMERAEKERNEGTEE